MNYFMVKPEVSGGLGENTILDSSTHPPVVSKLSYVFDGWSGDVLVTSFPCYLITNEAKTILDKLNVSGVIFSELEVSKSKIFNELFPQQNLPRFMWMQVTGRPAEDDFGISENFRLIVSERALEVLVKLKLEEARVSVFP